MMIRPLFSVLACALLLSALLVLGADAAWAQASGTAGSFSCANGQAVGSLYSSGVSCPATLDVNHLFSFLVCNMEQLSSNLMGNMFCGMISSFAPAVSAVLLLATVFFGVGFTVGVIPATAREFQVFLLKVTFIWVFATQSDYLLDIGYRFLVNGAREGVSLVLNSYNGFSGAQSVYEKLDSFLGEIIKFAASSIGGNGSSPGNDCKNAIFAVMAVMAIAFPPIFFLAIALLMRIAITFVRAVFGYVYALVGIAFLLSLAPFFLSFYMFKQTRAFFDKWIGYLASFALQIVILFAFLGFALSINTTSLTGSLTQIVMKTDQTFEGGSFRAPWSYCTVCDFEVVDQYGIPVQPNEYERFLSTGKLRCKTPQKPITLDTAASPNAQQTNALIKFAGTGLIALLVLAYVLESVIAYAGALSQTLASSLGGATYAPQLTGGQTVGGRPGVDMPGDGLYKDFEAGFDRGYGTQGNAVTGVAEGFRRGMSRMVTGREESGGHEIEGAGMKNRFMSWLADPNHMDRDH